LRRTTDARANTVSALRNTADGGAFTPAPNANRSIACRIVAAAITSGREVSRGPTKKLPYKIC
jgi:hypothetical protein